MGRFFFTSSDGTRVSGWRGYDRDGPRQGLPVVISNGLGTPPQAWPALLEPGSGFDVCAHYYRGTAGGDRPADATRVRIVDHVDDLLALMDHEGVERALLACWSLGVNVAFELTRRHPDRVHGLLAVAGVPGGTFRAMFGPLRVPRGLRHHVGLAAAHVGRASGPALSWVARQVPLNRTTATLINHSGFVLPAATPERLLPALEEFRTHDFRWYFTLAVAAAAHQPMDLSFVQVPVTLVAGRHDVLTSMRDMIEAAERIPHAELAVLPGSHFLPLEFPEELAQRLCELAARCGLVTGAPQVVSPT